MTYTIKDLQIQGYSKTLVYEALKTVGIFSKQFVKNKRVFNDNDLKIFQYYKQFGSEKTVLKFGTSQKAGKSKTVSNTPETVSQNSFETVSNREEELQETIKQKEAIIKVKEEQSQKYALLKQEEKKEKEEWIKKYDVVQNEKSNWMKKYYSIIILIYILILLLFFSISMNFGVIKFNF